MKTAVAAPAPEPNPGVEQVLREYQRFYDFVGDCDPAIVDAWHFTENVRKLHLAKLDVLLRTVLGYRVGREHEAWIK